MPFTQNKDLPSSVTKAIPSQEGQTLFRRVVNSQLANGKSESVAFASAWAALQNAGYSKEGGVWVKKNNPTVDSVHVPSTDKKPKFLEKAYGAKPIYGFRPVLNAEEICEWAGSQGFTECLIPDEMHVTVLYSKRGFSINLSRRAEEGYDDTGHYDNVVVKNGLRSVESLGDKGAVVLKIEDERLQTEWQHYLRFGAAWDFPSYLPHITLTYRGAPEDLSKVVPYTGDIVLGPTRFRPLDADGFDPTTLPHNELNTDDGIDAGFVEELFAALRNFTKNGKRVTKNRVVTDPAQVPDQYFESPIIKVDEEQRIVWGWASVSTVKGKLVVDLHGDTFTPEEMVKSADEFMMYKRTAKAMHKGKGIGFVLHSFPLTKEIGKALGVESDREGWIIAMKILDEDYWRRIKSGEFRGFSFGGKGKRIDLNAD